MRALLPLLLMACDATQATPRAMAPTPTPGARPACRLEAGQELDFHGVHSLDAQGQIGAVDTRLAGAVARQEQSELDLRWQVREAQPDGVARVELTLVESVPGQWRTTARAELEIGADCGFERLRWLGEPDPEGQDRLEALLMAVDLQAAGEGDTWTTVQMTQAGPMRLAWRSVAAADGRTRLTRRIAGRADPAAEPLPPLRTSWRAELDPAEPWALRVESSSSGSWAGGLEVHEALYLERVWTPWPWGELPEVADTGAWASLGAGLGRAHGRRWPAERAPAGIERRTVDELFSPALISGALASRVEARGPLVYLLRARDDQAEVLAARVLAGPLPGHLLGEALLALGDADTPATRAALLEIAASPWAAVEARAAAMYNLARSDQPTRADVDGLAAIWDDPGAPDAVRATAGLMVGKALGQGALGPEARAAAAQALAAHLAAARQTPEQLTALRAVANARDASFTDGISNLLHADSPLVRGEAWETLARVGALPPLPEALAAARADGHRRVAQTVARLAGASSWAYDADAVDAASRAAQEPDAEVRAAAIAYLVNVAPRSVAARASLSDWYDREPDLRLRRWIATVVQPGAAG